MYDGMTVKSPRVRDKWEIEDDVRTLTRAAEIKKDPERVRDAQNYLKEKRATENSILGIAVPPPTPGRKNPATIQKLTVFNK